VSPALMLILGGMVASAAPASTDALPTPAPPQVHTDADTACRSQDARNIVVCGQRGQQYRVDPSVMKAGEEVKSNRRSATSAKPAAQAACSSSPAECTKDLKSLDLANVAMVVGTAAVRAAKGEDWAKVFRPGGSDEYQLYREAKQRREAAAEKRAAAEVKRKAEEQVPDARPANVESN
jgi:hypothetical protein